MKKIVIIALCLLLVLSSLFGCGQSSPEETLNVLAIGSYGKDILTYAEPLAEAGGQKINAAYLDLPGSTLRDLASAFVSISSAFTYYEADGTAFTAQNGVTAEAILAKGWDVIILQQAVVYAGFQSTYNADLEYLTDYIRNKTEARLYWNMSWAAEEFLTDEALLTFYNYYGADSAAMYNAIVDCLDTNVIGNAAFDGWIPTGAAIRQIREQMGNMTKDGHRLGTNTALLTASLATVKTLLPDYDLTKATCDQVTDDELALICAAVEKACNADALPEIVDTAPIPENKVADITIGQTGAPMRLHFPDLAVLENGTIIVGAFENICHKPTQVLNQYQEGAGRLLVWASHDNGATWNYGEPLLVVDQQQIEQWGLAKISGRYETLKSSTDYAIFADPRDPNFSTASADMDGDGTAEEVLLFTFWIKFYKETGSESKCYLIHSTDGGSSWSAPQNLLQITGVDILKRGDIASFSDGQILIPYYRGKRAGGLLMEYDANLKEWVLLRDSEVTNFAPAEGENFNEVSFVAPDPDADTVYAYCRENGIVLRSDDRGGTWEYLANEEGLIHQPGFTVLDKDHVYVTWTHKYRPRPTYGKVFDLEKGWDSTKAQLIYASPDAEPHDAGDPSCALLKDGRVLVVSYDTAFRSIVGNYIDPNK